MFNKNKLNLFLLSFIFLILISAIIIIILSVTNNLNVQNIFENNDSIINEDIIQKETKDETTEKDEGEKTSFYDFSQNIFEKIDETLKKTIIENIDKNKDIKNIKEENFKFDPKLFQKEIIKLIGQKIYSYNLKVHFEYYSNFRIVKVTIINNENINEKIIKKFKISFL